MSKSPLREEDFVALREYLVSPKRSEANKYAFLHMFDVVSDALKRLGYWDRFVAELKRRGDRWS